MSGLLWTRNGHERAGDTAIPCASGTCSYAATNDKSGTGNEVISRKRSATKEIGRAAWRATIAVYGNRRETPDLARSRRSAEHSFLSAFQFSVFQLYPVSLFPFLDQLPSVFSALGEKAKS